MTYGFEKLRSGYKSMAISALNKQIVHHSNLMQSLAKWVGCAIFAGAIVPGRADVVVSEFMADNATTIADEDGDFSDWIELFNNGESPVSLAGWYLTDTRENLTQWETPAVTLQPGEFLLVFASGKDRAQLGSELHTNFRLDAGGEYLGLIRSDGTSVAWEADFPEQREDISYGLAQDVNIESYLAPNIRARYRVPEAQDAGLGWVNPVFSDAQWALGQGGFGYQSRVPGFQVRMVESLVPVVSLGAATTVLQNPGLQGRALTVSSSTINYVGASTGGNYGSDLPFPGDSSVSDDREDFILEITGIITIPQTGFWTFGVNSDDGFSLEIGDFSVSFPNPRGPSDTLQQFQFNQAGDYPLRLVYYERGGGACLELFAASGALAEAGWNGNDFFLVGDENPLGLSVSSEPAAGLAALSNMAAGVG
jgi:hypothetical protein